MTPEEILIKAAEDLGKYGHHKQTFYGTNDPEEVPTASACAYGSMARVAGAVQTNGGPIFIYTEIDIKGIPQAAEKLARQIRLEHPRFMFSSDYSTITNFNDDDNTTGEDVALMMKRAAHDS